MFLNEYDTYLLWPVIEIAAAVELIHLFQNLHG